MGQPGHDRRPPLWVGHISLEVPDPRKSNDFFVKLGMRCLEVEDAVAILELRGGTHLVLLRAEDPVVPGTAAPFDLMVDDLEAAHARYAALGFAPGAIGEAPFHRFFRLREPGGHDLMFNSSHVSDQPV